MAEVEWDERVAALEAQRLERLRAYAVLDTAPEADFDDIAALAADICQVPIALVSLVDDDRQWFKARVGLDVCETSRDSSFCAHAMWRDDVMEVPDALADRRFADNPLVVGDPHIRFYAGAPLVSRSGHPMGSLCVIDRTPRTLTVDQRRALVVIARHVVAQLELRQHAAAVEATNRRLWEADRLKDEFMARVSHELRTPLASIHGYLELIEDGGSEAEDLTQFMPIIRRNSDRLLALVNDLLLAAQLSTSTTTLTPVPLDLAALARTIAATNAALATCRNLTLDVDAPGPVVAAVDAKLFPQAIERLVLNALKFTSTGTVTIRVALDGAQPVIEVRDSGAGMTPDEAKRAFSPLTRGTYADQNETQGLGLGLSIVKGILDAHDATITASSAVGVGTTMRITLAAAVPAVPAQRAG